MWDIEAMLLRIQFLVCPVRLDFRGRVGIKKILFYITGESREREGEISREFITPSFCRILPLQLALVLHKYKSSLMYLIRLCLPWELTAPPALLSSTLIWRGEG